MAVILSKDAQEDLSEAKRAVKIAEAELDDAALDLEEAESKLMQCEGQLLEAKNYLTELLEGNDLKEYEDEDISDELPVYAQLAGYSLLWVKYRNCKQVTEVILYTPACDIKNQWHYLTAEDRLWNWK